MRSWGRGGRVSPRCRSRGWTARSGSCAQGITYHSLSLRIFDRFRASTARSGSCAKEGTRVCLQRLPSAPHLVPAHPAPPAKTNRRRRECGGGTGHHAPRAHGARVRRHGRHWPPMAAAANSPHVRHGPRATSRQGSTTKFSEAAATDRAAYEKPRPRIAYAGHAPGGPGGGSRSPALRTPAGFSRPRVTRWPASTCVASRVRATHTWQRLAHRLAQLM